MVMEISICDACPAGQPHDEQEPPETAKQMIGAYKTGDKPFRRKLTETGA